MRVAADNTELIVCVDTTDFFRSPLLETAGWPELLTYSRDDRLTLAIPAVVLMEAARHFEQQASRELERARSSLDELARLGGGTTFDLRQTETQLAMKATEYVD
ncbi:MAG: hypothetical protein QOI08_3131, partial [Actinomycetota bacterium]|nr:hypothetical protein [Actinomycetota bacterium]